MTNITVYHWKPPPPGWMKFNVANVVLEDEAGCGGVLRDDKGIVVIHRQSNGMEDALAKVFVSGSLLYYCCILAILETVGGSN
ncbi:hypothetical protein Gohar_008556, partial [Gossypium harknessii]|nr:hypothetical protein [Gossypium harknessii]